MNRPPRDVAIPIVFPDYLIAVATPAVAVDLPGARFDFTIPGTRHKVPELGHAGILFLNGATGLTRYYEYGRYDPAARGQVQKRQVPDVRLHLGVPTSASLAHTLQAVARLAGQGGRIEGAYVELSLGAFAHMEARAKLRLASNSDPTRESYALLTNSCLHFMKEVAEAGGAKMPAVIDPRPVGYIARVRGSHPALDHQAGRTLRIAGITLP